jgi:hypothetical protein
MGRVRAGLRQAVARHGGHSWALRTPGPSCTHAAEERHIRPSESLPGVKWTALQSSRSQPPWPMEKSLIACDAVPRSALAGLTRTCFH